jgi:hypothetical protein
MLSSAAYAQPQCTNLVYTGGPFTSFSATGSNATPLVPLAGTVTLAAALPANAVNLTVTPTAWNFPQPQISQLNSVDAQPLDVPETFTFSTDSSGNVTAWSISVVWGIFFGHPNQQLSAGSTQAGDIVSFDYNNPGEPPPNGGTSTTVGISTAAGSWTCQALPAVDPLVAVVAQLHAQVATLTVELASANQLKALYYSYYGSYVDIATSYGIDYQIEKASVTSLKSQLATANGQIATLTAELKKK